MGLRDVRRRPTDGCGNSCARHRPCTLPIRCDRRPVPWFWIQILAIRRPQQRSDGVICIIEDWTAISDEWHSIFACRPRQTGLLIPCEVPLLHPCTFTRILPRPVTIKSSLTRGCFDSACAVRTTALSSESWFYTRKYRDIPATAATIATPSRGIDKLVRDSAKVTWR